MQRHGLRVLASILAALSLPAPFVSSQNPALLKDINAQAYQEVLSGEPRELTNVGALAYFVAETRAGTQLMQTDGTSAGTVPVAGSATTHPLFGPSGLTPFGTRLMFSGWDDTHGFEPWIVENGRARLLKDIVPGSSNSEPREFFVHASTLYFSTWDFSRKQTELWRSDGTANGTAMVLAFPSTEDRRNFQFASVRNRFFFTAPDSIGLATLYVSDGTTANTAPLVAASGAIRNAMHLTGFGPRLYFTASDPNLGREVWSSDGTNAGTSVFLDIRPGPGPSNPAAYTVAAGKLWFVASNDPAGYELWESDGTAAGSKIHDLVPGSVSSYPRELTEVSGKLWFVAKDASGEEPWIADGTTPPTRVADVLPGSGSSNPHSFVALSTWVVFAATGTNGTRLFLSTGSAASTRELSTVTPTFDAAHDREILAHGPFLLFQGDAGQGLGAELYRSLPVVSSTTLIANLHEYLPGETQPTQISAIVEIGDKVYFGANDGVHGLEPWVSDGTAAGTQPLGNLYTAAGSSFPSGFTATARGVVFSAYDEIHGNELWITRGSAATTKLLVDIEPGSRSGGPTNFVQLGGKVYFRATNNYRSMLFETDGSAAGTRAITQVLPSSPFVRMEDALYWLSRSGLMRSDGTAAGTKPIAAIYASPNAGTSPMCVVGNRLFVLASTAATGVELWSSDGNTATLVADIIPGYLDAAPNSLTAAGGFAFFTAATNSGRELWRSDGTAAGTVLVRDIHPGYNSSNPTGLMAIGEECWFSAFSPATVGIWKSDGTSAGTALVHATINSQPWLLGRIGDRVLFTEAEAGYQPKYPSYTVDRRTGKVTALVTANTAPVYIDQPWNFDGILARGTFFFEARSDVRAMELHTWFAGASTETVGSSCAGKGRNPRLDATDPRLGQTWTITGNGFAPSRASVVFFGAPVVSPYELAGGCRLHVDLATFMVLGGRVGSSWTLAPVLPNVPSVIGLTIALQAFQLANDRRIGLDLSTAMHATFGR
ncbi:MAG: hypothetical protein KDC95_09900 [Planctomycetes bacterium]|nr:hypothetical protein [Planctomycetota bacterium]